MMLTHVKMLPPNAGVTIRPATISIPMLATPEANTARSGAERASAERGDDTGGGNRRVGINPPFGPRWAGIYRSIR
jgi:hypothetical protein